MTDPFFAKWTSYSRVSRPHDRESCSSPSSADSPNRCLLEACGQRTENGVAQRRGGRAAVPTGSVTRSRATCGSGWMLRLPRSRRSMVSWRRRTAHARRYGRSFVEAMRSRGDRTPSWIMRGRRIVAGSAPRRGLRSVLPRPQRRPNGEQSEQISGARSRGGGSRRCTRIGSRIPRPLPLGECRPRRMGRGRTPACTCRRLQCCSRRRRRTARLGS